MIYTINVNKVEKMDQVCFVGVQLIWGVFTEILQEKKQKYSF